MEVIYLLIPLSLLFLVASIWFFSWAVRNAQYDDLQGPAHRIILDDRDRQRSLTPPSTPAQPDGDSQP